jgi:RimJ/RimL family protein N-acetyltransferase
MADVRLERWGQEDAALLAELNGDPEQMEHVGGAETAEKIAERQERYVADPGCFVVVDEQGDHVGWVGFWEREWRGRTVFEAGWSIRRAAQGRGLATKATALLVDQARRAGVTELHAFPGVGNAASNRVCERVGFTLAEPAIGFEYPPGHTMHCNDWALIL